MGGEWSTPRPGRFTPRKDPVPIVQEAGGPHGRSGEVRKISPPPGFDPRNSKADSLLVFGFQITSNIKNIRLNTVT